MPDKASEVEGERIGGEERVEKLKEWRDALHRAVEGDESALPVVRDYLDDRGPRYLEFLNLARMSQDTQIKRIVGEKNLLDREVLQRKTKALREEVAGPDPSPLERLLAERVAMCWLQLYYAEQKYAEMALADAPGVDWEQEEWHQRRIDRLQRRYLSSIKSLAQIRKLGPAVQINIADKQINTTSG